LDAIAKMTLKLEHALTNPLHCGYIVAGIQALQNLCPPLGKHATFKYQNLVFPISALINGGSIYKFVHWQTVIDLKRLFLFILY